MLRALPRWARFAGWKGCSTASKTAAFAQLKAARAQLQINAPGALPPGVGKSGQHGHGTDNTCKPCRIRIPISRRTTRGGVPYLRRQVTPAEEGGPGCGRHHRVTPNVVVIEALRDITMELSLRPGRSGRHTEPANRRCWRLLSASTSPPAAGRRSPVAPVFDLGTAWTPRSRATRNIIIQAVSFGTDPRR